MIQLGYRLMPDFIERMLDENANIVTRFRFNEIRPLSFFLPSFNLKRNYTNKVDAIQAWLSALFKLPHYMIYMFEVFLNIVVDVKPIEVFFREQGYRKAVRRGFTVD